MQHLKPHPVKSFENLRLRIDRLFAAKEKKTKRYSQLSLDFPFEYKTNKLIEYPSLSLSSFLNFISSVLADGEVYLFGGLIRDMAFYGRRGFHSDIDVVVEGDWESCIKYLNQLGAVRNKFGGYRVVISEWPVDIWSAKETWAIREGLVIYDGISSLTRTTVLNWDAILMNWRTRDFVSTENYLVQLDKRVLDIVLEDNPDPLGMVVRVLRHLCSKDARKVTANTVIFLARKTNEYSFSELKSREITSYGNTMINPDIFKFFHELKGVDRNDIESKISNASNILKHELGFKT